MSVTAGRNSEGTPCRLCMKKNDNYYYNIFTSNLASTMTVEDAIHELVGLRVAVDDGLPSALCPLCMEKLIEFSDFKRICLESDAELRKFSSRNYSRHMFTEDEKVIGNSEMTNDSMTEAIGLSTPDRVLVETTPTSHLLAERNVWIDLKNDCIGSSASVLSRVLRP
ncbi:uncharacterized protein LOC124172018 [Ischnura elegans]|uniref:uncharacterized protein LOC124172018 n=1 Tax=Ischnura elegans TaxID=197161 RepID=UPI001ED87895|nr:uncharacterized protein LOC124172018 [Ischnura elegans]